MINAYEYFKNHPNYNKLVGNDYLFVEYKCPINVEDYQLWVEHHLITYVISGKKDWITSNQTYKLNAGDALFIRNGVYTTKQYLEHDYCVILFFINDAFIKRFIDENESYQNNQKDDVNHNQIFNINTNESFNVLIESIFHYLKKGDKIPRNLVEIKFKELLFNLVLNPKNHGILNFFNSIPENQKASIENIMLKNFQYTLKLEDFAKLCGRSLSTFKREFKTYFNTTPGKWLINKRLDYAQSLLIGTHLTISQVGYDSGFKNNSHFIQAFKAKNKLTPSQFKTKHQS